MTTDNKKIAEYPVFAATLRADMTQRNKSVAQLARQLDVSTNSVRKYLAGATLPGPITLAALARYLEVDLVRYLQDIPRPPEGRARRTPAAVLHFAEAPAPTPAATPAEDVDPLSRRRAEICADLGDMLTRYTTGADLRRAYVLMVQALESFTPPQ